MNERNKVPINVVTGFLGSGKTTLLGNILKDKKFSQASVIINEYGQAGLDHRLIRRIEERTVLLSGGCLCCNRREDLINELSEMLNDYQAGKMKLDRVVIETTGLADPAPILFSILTHPVLMHHYYIEGVLSCLDYLNGDLHLDNNPESVKQIVAADTVVITKTDLASESSFIHLEQRVFALNPSAKIIKGVAGKPAEDVFIGEEGFSPSELQEKLATYQKESRIEGKHAKNIHSMVVEFNKALDWLAFGIWMSMLLHRHGEKIFRIKGIVDVGESGPVVLNGVQHIIHLPQHLSDWREYETRNSQIVFIMKDIKPQEIMESLVAFQTLLGSEPRIQEISLSMFA